MLHSGVREKDLETALDRLSVMPTRNWGTELFASKASFTVHSLFLKSAALDKKSPLQAMMHWHKLKPELHEKQPYYLPGCDTKLDQNAYVRPVLSRT